MDIHVSNFPFDTTCEQVEEVFGVFGHVEKVKLVIDSLTGRARGYGFVTMSNDDEAEKAIAELDGQDFGGRPLKVKQSQAKKKKRK